MSSSKSSSSSGDRCSKIADIWSSCPDRNAPSRSRTRSGKTEMVRLTKVPKEYKTFINTLLSSCKPYTGKKVFVVHKTLDKNQVQKIEYVCPDYKIRIGHYDLSVSVKPNGYIYIHFLQDFMPNSQGCVYSGDHITIAPTGAAHIHFHITNIIYYMDYGQIVDHESRGESFCTLPIKDMMAVFQNKKTTAVQKKDWLLSTACLNEQLFSFNMNALQRLNGDRDTFDVIFRIFLRGFAPASRK